MNGYPAMFSFCFGVEKVTDQRSWAKADHAYYLQLAEAAIERGVMPDHDPREPGSSATLILTPILIRR